MSDDHTKANLSSVQNHECSIISGNIISMSKVINGSKLAQRLVAGIAAQVLAHQNSHLKTLNPPMMYPRLGIIMVGNHPASLSYIRRKKYLSGKANIKTRLFHLAQADEMEPN